MKIAVFIPSLRGGGAERAMLLFAEEMIRRGASVDLLLTSSAGPLTALVDKRIRIIDLKQPRVLRAVPKLVRYLRTERPDALYATIVHANVVSLIAGKLSMSGVPIIVRESNATVTEPKKNFSRWMTFKLIPVTYPWARGIIAVSEGVASELSSLSSRIAKLMTVVPTPVIFPELYDKANEPIEHPFFAEGQPPVILGTARLQPHKGFMTLIRAFAQIRKSGVEARLVILGEGPEKDNLLAEAARLGIAEHVSLPGFMLNPFPYMKRARTFVLASEYEGMPNVLIQAMALGTPAVATDCKSGPREILNGGEFGELVPLNDPDAMAIAIRHALEAPRRADAAARVADWFGVERATSGYLAVAGLEGDESTPYRRLAP